MTNFPNITPTERKIETITDIMTDIALFLFYLIALPVIIGLVGSAIASAFADESFVGGEYSRGTFLVLVLSSMYLLFSAFANTRKKEIYRIIGMDNIPTRLIQILLIILLPEMLGSLILWIFGLYWDYASFTTGFQIALLILFSLITIYYLKFFQTNSELEEGEKDTDFQLNLSEKQFNYLQEELFIPIICKMVGSIIAISVWQNLLYSSGTLFVLLFGLFFIQSYILQKLRNHPDIAFTINIHGFKTGFTISGFALALFSLYKLDISPILTTAIIGLLIFKLAYIFFGSWLMEFTQKANLPMRWGKIIRFNDIITTILFIGSAIFVSSLNNFGVVVIAIVFIIENGIERHFLLTMPKFYSSLLTFNLILIPFWIAFIILPWTFVGKLIVFTISLIIVGVILSRQEILKLDKYVIWQNIVYTALFWEIAIQFGIWSEFMLSGAFDSIIINYIFFITLGSLISFYRLYIIHTDVRKISFGKVIVVHYYILSFCGWLLLQKGFALILESALIDYVKIPNSMGLLMPSPLFGILGNFITQCYVIFGQLHDVLSLFIKSSDGLTSIISMDIAGLISIGLLWFSFKLHEEGKIIASETTQKNVLFFQFIGMIFIASLIFSIFQSFTGIGMACIVITFLLQNRYETKLKLHFLEEKKFIRDSQRLFLINLAVSLISLIFFGLEILQVNFSTALMLGLIALMIYQNFIPKVRDAIQHNVLNLLNAIFITTLAGLFIPSGIYLLETYSTFRTATAVELTIIISIFIVSAALLVATSQLKKGNYVSESRNFGITFILQLVMVIDVYALVVFNLLRIQLLYGHFWPNLQANTAFIMNVFFPLFGVWGITVALKYHIQQKNHPQIEQLWQKIALISWTGGIIASSIAIIFQFLDSALAINTGLLILGGGIIYPIIELQKMHTEKHEQYQTVIDRLITMNLFLVIGVIFFIGIEWLRFHVIGACILAFSILLLFINIIPFFRIHLTEKLRLQISAGLTIINSILIFVLILISIAIPSPIIGNPAIGTAVPLIPGLHPLSIYCILLPIPMTGIILALVIGIEKVWPKEKVMQILTRIILIGQSLSLIFVFSIIQEMIHLNWITALNFALVIFLVQWIKSPWIQKGVPGLLWNKILGIGYALLGFTVAFSLINILEQYTNYRLQDQIGISISCIIISVLTGLLASISRLKEGKNISLIVWMKRNLGLEFARILTVYATFVQIIFALGSNVYASSFPFQIFALCIPCLVILPWVGYNAKNFPADIIKQAPIVWKIEYLILWCIGSYGLIIAGLIFFEFIPLAVIIGIVCVGFCSIYSLIQSKRLNWISEERLSKVINFILLSNLLLIAWSVYFIALDLLYVPSILSSILALGTLLIFINIVPIFQKYMVPKVRIGITASLIILISLLFSGQIILWIMDFMQWTQDQIPLTVWFAIALIPIITNMIIISGLENRLINSTRALKLKQIGEIISIIDCTLIGFYGLSNIISPLLAFVFSTVIITILLTCDFLYLGWLTNRKIGILSFSIAFILNAFSISVYIASILPVVMDIQLVLFFYIYSPLVYLVVRFIIAMDRYLVQITPKSETKKMIQDKGMEEIPLIQSSKAEQFAEMISHQENQIKLAFICISLILTMYLNIRFIMGDINLLGLSFTSFITVLIASYSHFQRRNIGYFIHFTLTLLNLGILLIEYANQTLAVFFDNEFSSRILLLVLLIGLIQMMTASGPNTPLLKIISNINMIFAYFVFLAPFGLSFQYTLFFAVTLFSLLTPKSYFNLFFASLFPWTLVYNLGYGIIILGETSGITIISVPITIGLIWEWLLCVYYPDWHGTKLKKIIGFAAIYTTIFTYLNLLFEYPVVMQPVTPFVLTIMLFVLIRLKQLLPHRVQSLNYLVILDVFLLTFTVTAYYLFITMTYRYFLAISLSLSLSGFAFLYVIKQLKMVSQKSGIIANLSLGTISSGLFTFFLLIEPTLLNLSFDLAFPIAADLTVLAFFLAIGIYQHGFTRNIWASGWWMWNIVPLVNFTLIARLVSGVDYVTRTLRILNTDIQGSYILTIIICSFMYLPVIIYKIKNYLNQVIYIFWGELLALTIWGAVNLFPDNLSTQITFVFLIALVLLAPVFYYYKKWKQLFIIWPMLAVINVVFATILFNLPFIWQGPIDLLIMGLYILIMGYLPYVKEHFAAQKYWIILVGYFSIYLSLFIMLYSFVIMIFIDPIVSVNITFIVMAFGLLSGKYVDLNTRYVKIVLAAISTINIGILTARSFSLLPNMLIFGICLGIGFSCGSTLAFQARKYLPSGFSNQIRFIMAIGFGGAVFELLRVVLVLGIWATLGGFLLTSSFISFPLLTYRKHTKILLIIVAGSMFITEMIYGAPIIDQIPQVLVFLDILFTVLISYIYSTKESEWGLTRYITNDLEIFVILWEIFSGCISTSIVILLTNVPTISGFSLFAFFILFIALFNIITVKCVERYNLFAENSHTKHVINIITQAISLILYLDSALLLSLNIPVIGITQFLVENFGYIFAYRIGILAGFLCVEFGIIDKYTIKLIKAGLRNQITWITYFLVSISVFILLVTNYNNWFFALLIFCILSFGTILLLQQAYPQIPALKLRTINVLLSTANVMAIFWPILQVSENWALILAGPFTLNLVIGLGILYICMRLKFIDNRLQHWLYLLLSILIACTIEEYTRSWLHGSWLVNLGLFFLCINVINTFNVVHSKATYLYWTVLSFSVSTFIFEGINNTISIDLINALFYFALIWGSFTTFAYYMLADRVWIQIFPSKQILIGDSDEGKAKKIFIITAIIDIVLISIAITQAWNYILLNYILGQLNSDPLRSFLLSITLIPLLGLLLFSIILRYIEKNRLWFDTDAQVKKFLQIRNTIGLTIYFLIPSFLTLNIHYLVFSLIGLQYGIITDILVFSGMGIACLNLIDLHYLHLVNKNIVSRITTVGILVIGINLGILVMILTNNFLWGCIIFSLFSYLLQFVLPIEQMEKMRYYLNFSLYLEFLLQIGIGLFSFCPWFIALLLLSGVLHFAIELEQRVCFVPPITSYISHIAPWTWLGFTVISSLCLLLGFLPTFTLANFFGSILLFTAELFYYNQIINAHVPEKIVANRQRLGQLFYLELFIFLMCVLIPASLNITNVSLVELGLFRCLIYTSLVIIGFGIVFLDELFFQFIRKDHIAVFKRIIYYFFFILLGLDAALLVYLPFELMSPTIHTLGFSLSCLIGTGILFIAIRLYHNNRLFNQIAYLFFATQIVIFAYLLGATTGLITTLIIGILLYPFIFFLEQIERLIRQIIDWLVLFFHHIWQSLVNMVIAIKNWMIRYQRILMMIISIIVGIVSGYLSQNIFVGILLFLICMWNYSPERIEGFSTANFRNKVIYRGAIYFSLMGSFLSYIPLMPWVITLTILLFLGYIIWIVRTSEQLYQLSIYWRFFSALFAIIDFGVMIFLIVYM